MANNAAISHALDLGATTVYVLPTGYACALGRLPLSALGIAMRSLTLLFQRRLVRASSATTAEWTYG